MRRLTPELGKIDWEKKFESMPDNAPPKWMFRNITDIRENTEQIIAMLEADDHLRIDDIGRCDVAAAIGQVRVGGNSRAPTATCGIR